MPPKGPLCYKTVTAKNVIHKMLCVKPNLEDAPLDPSLTPMEHVHLGTQTVHNSHEDTSKPDIM